MSETVIFIIGVIVFAITVYGTVIAGGLAMQSAAHTEDDLSFRENSVPPPTDGD